MEPRWVNPNNWFDPQIRCGAPSSMKGPRIQNRTQISLKRPQLDCETNALPKAETPCKSGRKLTRAHEPQTTPI